MEGLMDHWDLTLGLHRDAGRGSHILASWKVMCLETTATGRTWPPKSAEAPIEEGRMSTKWLSLTNFIPFALSRGTIASIHPMKAYRWV